MKRDVDRCYLAIVVLLMHATSADSHVVVRELGIANLCISALGVASLWLPGWRPAAAFVGLLFFGAAGVL